METEGSFGKDEYILQLEQPCKDIVIEVVEAKHRGHNINAYVGYVIQMSKPQKLQVQRRYSQFASLRQIMQKRWPCCFIPVLPRKHASGSNSLSVVNERIKYLTHFVNCIAKQSYLYQSDQFQLFLYSHDSDLRKTYERYPKLTFEKILVNLKKAFPQIKYQNFLEIQQNAKFIIPPFQKFTKQGKIPLTVIKKQIRKLALLKQQYIIKARILYNQTLPQYQNYLQGDKVQQKQIKSQLKLFSNQQNRQLRQTTGQLAYDVKHNLYWLLYQAVRNQIAQQEAIYQAIASRTSLKRQYDIMVKKIKTNQQEMNNIKNNSFSLRTFFSNKNMLQKELEIENQLYNKQRIFLEELNKFVTALIVDVIINKYRQRRQKLWKNIYKKVIESQIQFSQNLKKMFEIILSI